MSSEAQILRNCFYDFYRMGLTTSSGGNVSCRTPDGLICISPSQIDKGFLKTQDFCSLNLNSEIIGVNKPSMEYPFHLAVYNSFPEILAILHFHPPMFVALSLMPADDPKLVEALNCFNIGYARYEIPGSDELGQEICKAVEKGFEFVLMQNHGILVAGKDVAQLCKKIVQINNELISYFNLEVMSKLVAPESVFNEPFEDSRGFYEKRAAHFLSLENEAQFKFDEEQEVFYTCVQLNSLEQLGSANFKINIIPESFLLLKNAKYRDHNYESQETEKFLVQNEKDIFIFNEGQVLLKGTTLYSLYDKLEVLDFTAKVLLLAKEIGNYQVLGNDQLSILEQQFFSRKS